MDGCGWTIWRDAWNRNHFSGIVRMINDVFMKISFAHWSSCFLRFFDFVNQYGILDCRSNHESLSFAVLGNIWMTIEECVENHLQSTIIPSGMSQVQYFHKKIKWFKCYMYCRSKNIFILGFESFLDELGWNSSHNLKSSISYPKHSKSILKFELWRVLIQIWIFCTKQNIFG